LKNYYLIHIQYLGFRFHGWAKQTDLKTVQLMVDKTLAFILEHNNFKTLGSSRTDAMVSANHMAFQLFINDAVDKDQFLKDFNRYLPNDIRAMKIEEVDEKFNIINTPREKEYVYLFAFGEKCHPYGASLMSFFHEQLDIGLMMEGAKIFEGKHNFKKYCSRPSEGTIFEREITHSSIEENNLLKANFFPDKSYAYHIHSKGFMRNQVRMMMGQLISLGKGEIGLEELKNSLIAVDSKPFRYIAPSSGLILNKINFSK